MQPSTDSGQKSSLRRFLAIYILSTAILIGAGTAVFYQYAYHRLLDHQFATLKLKTRQILPKLRRLHKTFAPRLEYPVVEGIKTALYDSRRHYLVGQFSPKHLSWQSEYWHNNKALFYRLRQRPYYLGVAYVVAMAPLDTGPIRALQTKIALFVVGALLFTALVARWLGRLFLAPVRRTLYMLERFIKDSTHELNTPVSTILTNIELLKATRDDLKELEEFRRIEMASRRLSRIYDDLAYLQLNHRRHRRPEAVDMALLLKERLDYFDLSIERKGLKVRFEAQESVEKELDREDAERLVDNLLSNAVKYTPPGGWIAVEVTAQTLRIRNGGKMAPAVTHRVTERFVRGDESEGGFGLGLSIVTEVARHYGFGFEIVSDGVGMTEARVVW